MVGFMPRGQLETNIAAGNVLIAQNPATTERIGYVIFKDKYFKREDLGIIYQLNVLPGKQRGLIGASLLKAQFERSAYGCKLYCCWCAQDIQANYFWESVGFVPIAFRAGSRAKERVHIFWQKRIRAGDTTTPYWFPSQTTGGAIREDRLVFPIPPGTTWQDAKPLILPGEVRGQSSEFSLGIREEQKKIAGPRQKRAKREPAEPVTFRAMSGLRAGPAPQTALAKREAPKAPKAPKVKQKNDPRLVAAARELRDRYLEEFNGGRLLPTPTNQKYDVCRLIGYDQPTDVANVTIAPLQLPAAA
jgi:hypothetical protein